jgi:hypothetical protein
MFDAKTGCRLTINAIASATIDQYSILRKFTARFGKMAVCSNDTGSELFIADVRNRRRLIFLFDIMYIPPMSLLF